MYICYMHVAMFFGRVCVSFSDNFNQFKLMLVQLITWVLPLDQALGLVGDHNLCVLSAAKGKGLFFIYDYDYDYAFFFMKAYDRDCHTFKIKEN